MSKQPKVRESLPPLSGDTAQAFLLVPADLTFGDSSGISVMPMDVSEATGRWRICDLLALAECSRCAPHHRHHWKGSALLAHASQNNLWCRKGPEQPWCIDITIGEGDREFWIFRRDPTVRIPWPEAFLRSDRDVPYLAPDLQILFKSKDPRPKDDLDATEVIPELTSVERSRLHRFLPEDRHGKHS